MIGNLKMIAVLVPKLRMMPEIAPSKPAMMEPTPMMVPVPMITPKTVRNDRILCSRTVESAKPIAALSSTQVIEFLPAQASSFHPQSFDRIEFRGALRRIDPEKEADSRRQTQADQHPR